MDVNQGIDPASAGTATGMQRINSAFVSSSGATPRPQNRFNAPSPNFSASQMGGSAFLMQQNLSPENLKPGIPPSHPNIPTSSHYPQISEFQSAPQQLRSPIMRPRSSHSRSLSQQSFFSPDCLPPLSPSLYCDPSATPLSNSISTDVSMEERVVNSDRTISLLKSLHKSKRVSWASDLDLCQVRLFLSEECPSQVGLNAQDHLQAKASLLLHPGGAGSDDILPPGFEGTQSSSQIQIKLSQIPVIKWTDPLKIVLNLTWQVVAGEESKEVEDQNQREMKVLEAIYPRPSSIPLNPSVSMDVEESLCNDDHTALIPITPIEDEDSTVDASSRVPPSSEPLLYCAGVPNGSNSPSITQLPHVVESEAAEASVALNHIMKNNEHGVLIDHELLNKILGNPEVIEMLVRDYGNTNNSRHTFNASSSLVTSCPLIPLNQAETRAPSFGAFSTNPSCLVPPQRAPPPVVSLGAPPAKDVNYYKSLIQQHGGDKQETLPYLNNIKQPVGNQETPHNSRVREPKPKIMKPCIYFNSAKGCRNGANCAYQHDVAFQSHGSAVLGVHSSKRTKMDNEISN